ncbi:hypothetical protein IL306_004595 [Fusarium sp. DS 682]|nr:hypothetical protein IL306_004595 [Fusarium sp. DS 682]
MTVSATLDHDPSLEPAQPRAETLLTYNADFKLLICLPCQYAIQPRAIERHLKEIHHLPFRLRRPYLTYASTFELSEPVQVLDADIDETKFPVPDLATSKVGIEKIYDDWESHDNLDEEDRGLLSHYLHSTYTSLINRHGNTYLWQITIPKAAVSYPFLRHGLLALAALHQSYGKGPSTLQVGFDEGARRHYRLSLSLFREATCKPPNNALECYAIIAYIHIHVLWSFRTFDSDGPNDSGDLLLTSDDPGFDCMAPWLYYVRHGCQLVCGFWDAVGNGPLGSLVRSWTIPIAAEDEISERIAEVFLSAIDNSGPLTEEIEKEYSQAARDLALALSVTRALGDELTIWDATRLWPLSLSHCFIQLMRDKVPCALLLLACYCIILDKLDHLWFANGVSARQQTEIMANLDIRWSELAHKLRVEIESILAAQIGS